MIKKTLHDTDLLTTC